MPKSWPNHLDQIDFELEDAESDVLGDAYEYLIVKFASGAGRRVLYAATSLNGTGSIGHTHEQFSNTSIR